MYLGQILGAFYEYSSLVIRIIVLQNVTKALHYIYQTTYEFDDTCTFLSKRKTAVIVDYYYRVFH